LLLGSKDRKFRPSLRASRPRGLGPAAGMAACGRGLGYGGPGLGDEALGLGTHGRELAAQGSACGLSGGGASGLVCFYFKKILRLSEHSNEYSLI
jgi:hypothetical protein